MNLKKGNRKFKWKKLLLGLKRPIIALIGTGLAALAVEPQFAWIGGIAAERLWATIEYYLKQ